MNPDNYNYLDLNTRWHHDGSETQRVGADGGNDYSRDTGMTHRSTSCSCIGCTARWRGDNQPIALNTSYIPG